MDDGECMREHCESPGNESLISCCSISPKGEEQVNIWDDPEEEVRGRRAVDVLESRGR